jgi:hypothetical protein
VNFRQWITRSVAGTTLLIGLVTMVQSQTDGPTEPLGAAWSRPMRDVIALAVSPEGERVLAGDRNGTVRCFDHRGTRLWEGSFPGIDRLVTSRHGVLTLAYSARQPLSRVVYFLDEAGKTVYTVEPVDPVQAAVISPDGTLAAVAAGTSIVFCSRRQDGVRQRTTQVSGEVRQIQSGPADSVYVVTRSPHAIQLIKSTGKVLWTRRMWPGREQIPAACSIWASEDGRQLAVARDVPGGMLEIALVSARNDTRWSTNRPGRSPRVRLAAGGSALLLAYEHKVEHQFESRYERRLAYLDANGGDSWTKGGAYTAPLHVAIDRYGEWVVGIDTQRHVGLPRFRLYGRGGERRWIYSSPASILIASSSVSGRDIVTYRADGVVEMMQVGQP